MRVWGPFSTTTVPLGKCCTALWLLSSVWLVRSSPDSFSHSFWWGVKTNWASGKSNWEFEKRLIAPPSKIRTCWLETCSKIICKTARFSCDSFNPGPTRMTLAFWICSRRRSRSARSKPMASGRWLWRAVRLSGSVATVTRPAPLWTAASAAMMMAPP